MPGAGVLVGLALTFAGAADERASAADTVRLTDGSVVLGQVVGPAARGGLVVLVRRDWARAHIPARLRAWESIEAPLVRAARRERKERLLAWKESRAAGGPGDPLAPGIDRETARLSALRPPRTVLTAMTFSRLEVRSVERRDDATARLLRLGWLAGLGGVETMSVRELRDALTLRGRLRPDDPGNVDPLLPLYPETAERWRTRRAATEVAAEPGLRFVRFRELYLPETGPGADANPATTTELIDSPAGRLAFGAIQAISPFDARAERLDQVAERGRVGAIASRVEFTVDSDHADAEATFWVREESGRWSAVFTRKATARPDEPADPAEETEGAPVRTAALILESVASTPSPPAVSRRREQVSTASERALGRARAALDRDLAPLLLPTVLPGAR